MAAIWKARDGREIPIEQMSDAHLANAIRMIERAYARWQALAPLAIPQPRMNGEFAQLAADEEWLAKVEAPIEKVYPLYSVLVAERWRRLAPDDPSAYIDDEPSGGP